MKYLYGAIIIYVFLMVLMHWIESKVEKMSKDSKFYKWWRANIVDVMDED